MAGAVAQPEEPARPEPRSWDAYYTATRAASPRPTLLHALSRFDAEPRPAAARRALDIGCGTGRDTLELLRRGWQVVAVDGQPAALANLLGRPDLLPASRLVLVLASFETARWPRVDLVNASYALPFCPPQAFARVWRGLIASLRPGGRFAGQFFGNQDEWVTRSSMTHHTRAAVDALLLPFEVELFREVEYDGATVSGLPKHWHVFDVVARKLVPDGPRSR